jgi:hypothetical protein
MNRTIKLGSLLTMTLMPSCALDFSEATVGLIDGGGGGGGSTSRTPGFVLVTPSV